MRTPVRIVIERSFPVPVEAAYAWLTDFRDDDAEHADGAVLRARRVIERSDKRVVYEGESEALGRRIGSTTEVDLAPPDAWVGRVVKGPRTGSVTRYRLRPEGTGSRVTVEYDFVLQDGLKHVILRLAKARVRRDLARMWDGFAASMTRELQAQSKPLA